MENHTFTFEENGSGRRMVFAPVFNAAAVFVDRHREAGRLDKVFLSTYDGETVTYGALLENVNRCGNLLLQAGLGRGERLLMVVKDSPEFLYLFWGAIKAGVVPVPLNTLLRSDDFQFLIEDSQASAIAYSPDFQEQVGTALEMVSKPPAHIWRTEGAGETIREILPRFSNQLKPALTAPDDECFWLYSSGSTGKPKGAIHMHRALAYVCHHVAAEGMGFREDDLVFSASKMFFAYGLGNTMAAPLWVGAASVVMAHRPTPELVFDVIEKFRPTLFFSVPTLYASLVRSLSEVSRDLSSLRAFYSSGESLPEELYKKWQGMTGKPVLEVMGTTETGYCIICSTEEANRPGFTGRLMPGVQAKIVDDDGHDVPTGKTGHLMIFSQSIAKGYWNNPEKTAATMTPDGWLRTGDTYARDKEGYFQCHGRDDDMLKISGIWCSPLEIEARLIEHPKVLESAVVGRPNIDDLIKPEAWVILKNPEDAGSELIDELMALCKEKMPPYKCPRWFHFVEELPKTATGKIQRVKLRALNAAPPPGAEGKAG